MPRMRIVALVVAALAGVGACAAPAPQAPAPAPAAATAAPAAVALPPEGTVRLTGDLREPGELTVEKLRGMTLQTVDVAYRSGKGPEQHTVTGVPLAELFPVSALATTDAKNDQLAFSVLAVGADGYAALVAYGEVSPDFGNRGILLAVTEDGTELARPRLVVPGDVKGGRYVSDVVELHVTRAAP